MPREIKTTLAVDGEAAFKRSINEANTSMKNLGTQLTLAAANFKKDGDAMKLVETRSKTLKEEIGQQEEIVKALEQAVKDSTDAYGENSAKTEKWEAELNRAKAKLTNLQSELALNDAGLDRNGQSFESSAEKAADYQATLQTVGKGISFENITSGIGSITKGFESAVKKVWSFAKSMRETMVDAGKWADELMTDATKYGMDVETLQAWRNAADFIDTDVSTIISAQDKLGKKMSEGWTKGSGDTKIDMWEMLGIDLTDAETGKYREKMDIMFELGETLMSMAKIDGNDVRADEYAMEVFGKSWRELLPLFTAGQAEWEQTVANQKVVSEEHVKALGEMDDANNQLEDSWETLKYTALAEIAPVLTDATTALAGLLDEMNEWIGTEKGQEAMDGLAESLQSLFSGLKDISFKDAIETAKGAIDSLKSALEWLNENKDNVVTALEVIGVGFAGLKVADVALNVGKIVSGFQTLWGGANNKLPSLPGGDGVATSGGGNSSIFGNGLFKWGTAAAVFLGVLGKNVITAQGNDDILDENGNITETAAALGYYRDANGQVQYKNAGPQVWELEPERSQTAKEQEEAAAALRAASEEIEESVDLTESYTPEQIADAIQDWWDARRNAENDEDSWDEEERAYDYMKEALGDSFGDFWDTFVQKTDGLDTSGMEDIPSEWYSNLSSSLNDAVASMKVNTESAKASADKIASADFKRFNSLPTEIQAATQRGAAAGVSGIVVRLDGATVGRLVAPYVNAALGYSMG